MLVALALIALAAPLGAQEFLDDCRRVNVLDAALGSLQVDPRGSLDELAVLEEKIETLLPELSGLDTVRAQIALSSARSARGRYDGEAPFEDRLEWAEQGVEHARRSGIAECEARGRLRMGEVLALAGRLTEAREALQDTVLEVEKAVKTMPFVHFVLSDVEIQRADYLAALGSLEDGLRAMLDGRDWDSLRRRTPVLRGRIFLGLGLFDLAALESEDASDMVRQGGVHAADVLVSEQLEINLWHARGRPEKVVELVRSRLENERYAGVPALRASLLSARGQALTELSRKEPALESKAIAAFDEARAIPEFASADALIMEMRYAGLKIRRGELAGAQELLESARSRLDPWKQLRDPLGTSAMEAELETIAARLALARGGGADVLEPRLRALTDAVHRRIELWSLTPNRQGGLGFLHYGLRRSFLGALIDLSVAVHGPRTGAERALEELMRVQAESTLVRRLGGETGDLDSVRRELLDEERGMLIYLPAPEGSHVFALDREGLAYAELDPESSLTQSELLPPEVLERLREWRGVTIVGADLLGHVAFEQLPLGSDGPLGIARAVDYLPSLPLGLALRRREKPEAPELDLVVVGAPVTSPAVRDDWPDLAPLDFGAEEARDLTLAYAPSRTLVLSGSDATRARLVEVDLSRTRSLQFLAHAVQDGGIERPAAIVLTGEGEDEGLLTCDDAEELSAPPLVLLFACRAGLGPERPGDEASGHLGGAWLVAGACAVVLSDSDLDLGPSLRLAAWMHDRLVHHGASPAEALRFAREQLVAEGRVLGDTGRVRVLGLGQEPLYPEAPPEVGVARAPTSRSSDVWLLGAAGLAAAALVAAAAARRARRS